MKMHLGGHNPLCFQSPECVCGIEQFDVSKSTEISPLEIILNTVDTNKNTIIDHRKILQTLIFSMKEINLQLNQQKEIIRVQQEEIRKLTQKQLLQVDVIEKLVDRIETLEKNQSSNMIVNEIIDGMDE